MNKDERQVEADIREAAIRCGCDPEQAEDLITEFWVLQDIRD